MFLNIRKCLEADKPLMGEIKHNTFRETNWIIDIYFKTQKFIFYIMEKELLNNVIKSIGKFNSHKKSEVYLHEPNIDKNDWINVKECLKRKFCIH